MRNNGDSFWREKPWRRKNIQKGAQDAGVSKKTVRRGMKEIEEGDLFPPGARQRKKGTGRNVVEYDSHSGTTQQWESSSQELAMA